MQPKITIAILSDMFFYISHAVYDKYAVEWVIIFFPDSITIISSGNQPSYQSYKEINKHTAISGIFLWHEKY